MRSAKAGEAAEGRKGLRVSLGSCPRPAAATQPSGSRVRGGVGGRAVPPRGSSSSAVSARAAAPPAGHLALAGPRRPPRPAGAAAVSGAERSALSSVSQIYSHPPGRRPGGSAPTDESRSGSPPRGPAAPAAPAPGTIPFPSPRTFNRDAKATAEPQLLHAQRGISRRDFRGRRRRRWRQGGVSRASPRGRGRGSPAGPRGRVPRLSPLGASTPGGTPASPGAPRPQPKWAGQDLVLRRRLASEGRKAPTPAAGRPRRKLEGSRGAWAVGPGGLGEDPGA